MNIGNALQSQTRAEGQSGRSDGASAASGQGFANVFAGLNGAGAAAAAVQASHMPAAAQVAAESVSSEHDPLAEDLSLTDAGSGDGHSGNESRAVNTGVPTSDVSPPALDSDAAVGGAGATAAQPAVATDQSAPVIKATAAEFAENVMPAGQNPSTNRVAESVIKTNSDGIAVAQEHADDQAFAALQMAEARVHARAAPPLDDDQDTLAAADLIIAGASVPLALNPETTATGAHSNPINSQVRGSFTAQAGTPAAMLAQAEWARLQSTDAPATDGGREFASVIDGVDGAASLNAPLGSVAMTASGPQPRAMEAPLFAASPQNPGTPVPSQQLTQHAVAIIREMGEGRSEATIELHPAELGKLDLDMRQDGQRLDISVTVDNEQSRRLVQDQFAQWRERLAETGLQLQSLNVDVRDQSADARQNSDSADGGSNSGTAGNVKNSTRVVIRDPSRALDAYA